MIGPQRFLQFMLLSSIPLLQSLLLSSNNRVRPSLNQKCNRVSLLFAGRNPFRRNDSSSSGDSVENEQLSSKSALFSSSGSRGRRRNVVRSEGIPHHNMHPDEVGAVRTISLLGGFLSIVFTRDIWYAVSSFLLINIFASQSNSLGMFIRGIGGRVDALSRNSSRKRMVSSILDFLKAVNEASVLNEVPSNLRSTIRNIEINEEQLDEEEKGSIDDGAFDNESSPADEVDRTVEIDVPKSDFPMFVGEYVTDDDDAPDLPNMVNLASKSVANSNPQTVSKDVSKVTPSTVRKIESNNAPRNIPIGPIEHISASDAVIKATIEVQAAADASSARLKIWLTQQRSAEEEKKKLKLSLISEKLRIEDLPKMKDELIEHMANFVSSSVSDLSSLAVAIVGGEGEENEENSGPKTPFVLGSFSSRAIEASAGSINDFVAVLTSPGKNSLKQRYRQLAKEFHPDSARNVDLPDSTVNSLMANLTGAFNYLSGANSLSKDGHTLMSAESPWGVKYTGRTDFDLEVPIPAPVPVVEGADAAVTQLNKHPAVQEDDEEEEEEVRIEIEEMGVQRGFSSSTDGPSSPAYSSVLGAALGKTETEIENKKDFARGNEKEMERVKEKEEREEDLGTMVSMRNTIVGIEGDTVEKKIQKKEVKNERKAEKMEKMEIISVNRQEKSWLEEKEEEEKVEEREKSIVMQNKNDNENENAAATIDMPSSPPLSLPSLPTLSTLPSIPPISSISTPSLSLLPISPLSTVSIETNPTAKNDIKNDIIKVEKKKLSTGISMEERSSKNSIEPRDNTNIVNNDIQNIKDTKNVKTDFASPYNSQQQVLMWKNWGKDIDWGKMKFQGNSDIYTRAQEELSRGGGNNAIKRMKNLEIDDGKENMKKMSMKSTADMPILSSDPFWGGDSEGGQTDGRINASVRAAYVIAAPKEKDNKNKKEKITSVIMMVREVVNKHNGRYRSQQVLEIKNGDFNSRDNRGIESPEEREEEIERLGGDRDNGGGRGRDRMGILTAVAAQVLLPPT